MSISLVPAGIRVAGQNLISGFPLRVLCGSVRCIFFVTAPARLDLGLPRRTALQGFASIRGEKSAFRFSSSVCFVEWFAALSSKYPSLLVEGAGGWLVPVTDTETLADLAVRLALPVIPVVANRLGCINHTLLTLESIRARGLACPGIILNHLSPPADPAQHTNAQILSRHTQILLEIHPGQSEISPTDLTSFLEAMSDL
jgi:hypothetical protein